jgi:cytochrome c oxidase assembly protein subunit 11
MTNEGKNRRVGLLAASVAVGMVGMAYAAVPLYKMFCQVTGFGGTTQVAKAAPAQSLDQTITVRFDANSDGNLGWNFHPKQNTMTVKLGESNMAFYEAKNLTNETVTGSAVFNVTPVSAGIFFNKIQCFCFTKQTLKPGETVEMPVQFFVDPAIIADANTAGIDEITLSYTFYPAIADASENQAAPKTN